MKILENKIISIILMLVLIAGGLFIGGMKGLNGLYSDVEDVFFLGVDRDGIGVANDIGERVVASINMTTIARKYEVSAPVSLKEAIDMVNDDIAVIDSALEGNTDIKAAVAANKKIDSSMAILYNELGQINLSTQDEKYRQSLYADFNSRGDTISHDPYNQYAQEYTNVLDGFPASLIAAVMPVKEAVVVY